MAYVELADVYAETGHHREAEDTFQKVLSLEVIEDHLKQAIYFHYGWFQEFQRNSEVNAIIHYLKAITIEQSSFARDKIFGALEKLVLRKLWRNTSDIESLSILWFIYKLKGEINEALEYYEWALKLAAGFESFVGHDCFMLK